MRAPRLPPLSNRALGELAELDLSTPDCDATAMEHGRLAFRARALDEQRSLVAFSELLGELCEAGAPIDVIGSLTRVVRDEAVHVELCDRMVKRLGGWDASPPSPAWVRSNKRWPLRKRILGTILGSLCVGETISVAIFRGCRDGASDETAHVMLTQMLADESFHARFGFYWLEAMPLREEELPFATGCVRAVLRSVARDLLPQQRIPQPESPFGFMSPTDREAAIIKSIEKTIVPGFEKAGIGAAKIWDEVRNA
jgi:hypothetical protein